MKLGLGTVQFGMHYGIANTTGRTATEEVKLILSLALQNGMNILDTASGYGDAEKVLGETGVDGFKIISKFLPADTEVELEKQLATSLNNLKVKRLYGYLAHRPQDLLVNIWQWKYLQEQKVNGVIEKIGFSLNEPSELHQLLSEDFIPDLVQVPYNFLDRRFEKDLVELKRKGTEIHVRSAFLQGLFFTDTDSLSSFLMQ
ncbi:MAG: aldo/keto reductase [Chitinophagaceae bacterium]|nr:aldo/keto reductase [Chitinophagaceae bacterium]